MVGVLNSTKSYIELKKYIKEFNEARERLKANPVSFSSMFDGKTPNPDSVKDVVHFMSFTKSRKKREEFEVKYAALAQMAKAINGKDSDSVDDMATLSDLDESYYCFTKELSHSVETGKPIAEKETIKHLDGERKYSLEEIETKYKAVEDAENSVKEGKAKLKKARRKRFLKRLAMLLPVLPALITMAVVGGVGSFAIYAWYNSVKFMPALMLGALTVGSGALGLRIMKKSYEKRRIDLIAANMDVKKAKEEEKALEDAQTAARKDFKKYQKYVNSELRGGYRYEAGFDPAAADIRLEERLKYVKSAKEAERAPEKATDAEKETAKETKKETVITSGAEKPADKSKEKPSEDGAKTDDKEKILSPGVEAMLRGETEATAERANAYQNGAGSAGYDVGEREDVISGVGTNPQNGVNDSNAPGTGEVQNDDETVFIDTANPRTGNAQHDGVDLEDINEAALTKDQLNSQPTRTTTMKTQTQPIIDKFGAGTGFVASYPIDEDELNFDDLLGEAEKAAAERKQRNASRDFDEDLDIVNSFMGAGKSNVRANQTSIGAQKIDDARSAQSESTREQARVQNFAEAAVVPAEKKQTAIVPAFDMNKDREEFNARKQRNGKRSKSLSAILGVEPENAYAERDERVTERSNTIVHADEKPQAIVRANEIEGEDAAGSRLTELHRIHNNIKAAAEREIAETRKARQMQEESLASDDFDDLSDVTADVPLDDEEINETEPTLAARLVTANKAPKETRVVSAAPRAIVKTATKDRNERANAKRNEAISQLQREGEGLSHEEMFGIMNRALEDNYTGKFDEIAPADFMRLDDEAFANMEEAKEIKRRGAADAREREFVARSEYERAVCDYYGKFVARTYTDGRVIKPTPAIVAYAPNEELSYDDLKKKKSVLVTRQKAFKALSELGRVSLANSGADEEVIAQGLAAFSSQIDLAKTRAQEVDAEIDARNQEIMVEVADEISSIVNSADKRVTVSAEKLKIAAKTAEEKTGETAKELAKKKYQQKSNATARESLENKLEYLKECSSKIDAFVLFKQLNYKRADELAYSLVMTDCSAETLEVLESLFKSKGERKTPKSKVVAAQLEMQQRFEELAAVRADEARQTRENARLANKLDGASGKQKDAIARKLEKRRGASVVGDKSAELKEQVFADAQAQMQIIADFQHNRLYEEQEGISRLTRENPENAAERVEKFNAAVALLNNIERATNFSDNDYASSGLDKVSVLEQMKEKSRELDGLVKLSKSKRVGAKQELPAALAAAKFTAKQKRDLSARFAGGLVPKDQVLSQERGRENMPAERETTALVSGSNNGAKNINAAQQSSKTTALVRHDNKTALVPYDEMER